MSSLLQIEKEVLVEGREWTRQRLEQRLQNQIHQLEADWHAQGTKLTQKRFRSLELLTVSGTVRLKVLHGYDAQKKQRLCPVRELWKLEPYQRVSPELQARLCQTATELDSYEAAARITTIWDSPCSDDLIHHHVQKIGQSLVDLKLAPSAPPKSEAPFSLVIMMDGWMVRERGPDWGAGARKKEPKRVEWHDVKSAVIYRLDQRIQKGGRGLLAQKYVVAVPPMTEPVDFGAAVQAEARRRGLGRAQQVYLVMDGAVYLWGIAEDRFKEAIKTLDFYHASQHLWAVAHAQYGENSDQARQWVEPLLHQLRHGKESKVVRTLQELAKGCTKRSATGRVIHREAEYFRTHQDHIHYQKRAREGAPIGSGAVESFCGQLQNRFKTTGQFWQRPSLANLLRVAILCRNNDQNHIWN